MSVKGEESDPELEHMLDALAAKLREGDVPDEWQVRLWNRIGGEAVDMSPGWGSILGVSSALSGAACLWYLPVLTAFSAASVCILMVSYAAGLKVLLQSR